MKTFKIGKSLWMRFLRGFIAGAVGAMVTVNVTGVNTFTDIKIFFTALAYSGIIGGVTGGLLALDKYIRSN